MEVATIPLKEIVEQVMQNPSVQDKIAIYRTHASLGESVAFKDPFSSCPPHSIPIGDDCAAIPDGIGGYLLFAAEGIIPPFVKSHPWFAGYSAVLVNISDVCAMGGLPMALTDVVWLKDQEDGHLIWEGMQAASKAYGVPIVGGHTCYNSPEKHLAVSILGKANQLLSSYDAQPGEILMMAVDLNGSYFESYPFWNASTTSTPTRLQTTMRLLHKIADSGLSKSAKDISMGGIIGTLAMLLHTSSVGAHFSLDYVPKPDLVSWEKWLISFPSFGYLLTAKPTHVQEIKALFHLHDIACASIGEITAEKGMTITFQEEKTKVL